jgi:hypothetical protein
VSRISEAGSGPIAVGVSTAVKRPIARTVVVPPSGLRLAIAATEVNPQCLCEYGYTRFLAASGDRQRTAVRRVRLK